MSYRVKTVSQLTGIPRPTLLAWERRYGITSPDRTGSNYRVYTDDDVLLLRRLKALVDRGHPIGEAVAIARADRSPAPGPSTTAVEIPVDPGRGLSDALFGALSAYDRAATDHLGRQLATLPFQRALDEVLMPLLSQTGTSWADGRISIAQEHFISGWCREQMVSVFHALGGGPSQGPLAVCAMVPGDAHELGLLAVGIRLALDGWRVNWLGTELPVEELREHVRVTRPDLVCLSTMLAPPRDALLHAQDLRREAPSETLVALGGRAATGLPSDPRPGLLVRPTLDALRADLPAARPRSPA